MESTNPKSCRAERREEREAQKRLSELEQQSKAQEKLSATEQALLEVAAYENGLDVLLSVHKEQGEVWDWLELAAALPPPSPGRIPLRELKAQPRMDKGKADEALALEERAFQEALEVHSQEIAKWEKLSVIARGVLFGEQSAYKEALAEFGALPEIAALGSAFQYTVHSASLVECRLKVNGRQVIPKELKTLTSTGKVSTRPMPKARFHEIYQDYVSGCVLRTAREVFALLPFEMALVTAFVDALNTQTGHTCEQAVLSAAVPRAALGRLDFERLDPSDALETFLHRGDAKVSRRSGGFDCITPLTLADLPQSSSGTVDFLELLAQVRLLRGDLRAEIEKLNLKPMDTNTPTSQRL